MKRRSEDEAMDDDNVTVVEGEVMPSEPGTAVSDRAGSDVSTEQHVLKGMFWQALRFRAMRRLELREARWWEAAAENELASWEYIKVSTEVQRAIREAEDIETILQMDAEEREEKRLNAETKRKHAELELKKVEAKLAQEGQPQSDKSKKDEYREELKEIRKMFDKPKVLWAEFSDQKKKVFDEYGGEDKLPPEVRDELDQFRNQIKSILDNDAI